MRRAQSLPDVAVDGEAIGLPLADNLTTQALSGLLVVAVRAARSSWPRRWWKNTFPASKKGAAGPSLRTSMGSPRD